jgi:uncharacterized membrane protein YecN with MAPEG domain
MVVGSGVQEPQLVLLTLQLGHHLLLVHKNGVSLNLGCVHHLTGMHHEQRGVIIGFFLHQVCLLLLRWLGTIRGKVIELITVETPNL